MGRPTLTTPSPFRIWRGATPEGFDVIPMDVQMSEMDGSESTRVAALEQELP